MVSYLGVCLLLVVATGCFGQNAYNTYSSALARAAAQANYPSPNNYNLGNNARYRPCPQLNLDCIRQYLASNSNCRIVNPAAAREPFYAPIRTLDLPSINVTLTRFDVTFSNVLSGRVEEFFVDYQSGYTLLSVDYTGLTVNTREARYETNRRADVPLIENTPTRLIYPGVAITTVFPSSNALNLANSRNTGFLATLPELDAAYVGQALTADYANLDSTSVEAFTTTAPIVNRFFIQNILCDFGIQPNQLGTSS